MARCSLAAAMGLMHSSLKTIRDNPYVPPVVITSFKIFNKPVPIGAKSVLTKAISYVDGLTLSYRDNVFSFEFAALSYANSRKNRYRYKLENFDPGWNEVGSKQRLATYTNLDPGNMFFACRDRTAMAYGMKKGCRCPFSSRPPGGGPTGFAPSARPCFLALLWAAYQFRVRQLQREFNMRLRGARRRADAYRPRTARHAVAERSGADVLVPGGAQPASGAHRRGYPHARRGHPRGRRGHRRRPGCHSRPAGRPGAGEQSGSICSRPQERNSRDLPVRRANRRHSGSLWKERGSPCRRSFRTRSTGLRARSCETPFSTRTPAASRPKSPTTANSSG